MRKSTRSFLAIVPYRHGDAGGSRDLRQRAALLLPTSRLGHQVDHIAAEREIGLKTISLYIALPVFQVKI